MSFWNSFVIIIIIINLILLQEITFLNGFNFSFNLVLVNYKNPGNTGN